MFTERPLVVLDRDGVINEDSPDFIKTPGELRPIPGSVEAIARLSRARFRVAVASNQSGIGRGLIEPQALLAIHAKLIRMIEAAGGALAAIYVCPHHPDAGCPCRKPRAGLLERLANDLQVDITRVPVIGDSARDLEAARAVGARPMLVRTGNGAATAAALRNAAAVEIFNDLAGTADHLIGETR